MEMIRNKPIYQDYLYIVIGTLLMAVAITSVFDPMNIVTGGFTGMGIIIKSVTKGMIPGMEDGISLGLSNLVINIPLFLLAVKVKGKRFLGRTVFATLALSFFLWAIPVIPGLPKDTLLNCIFGGVISGIGTGLVFIAFATTGGTDLMAMIIQHRAKSHSVSMIMGILDGIIVIAGAVTFGLEKAMYALIVITIVSKVSDNMMEGMKFSKMAYIISDHGEAIAKEIMDKLERGVTHLSATGMYTGDPKSMMVCVVSKKEVVDLKEIVRSVDSNSFIIVSDVREALGEGFLQYR